MPEGFYDTQEAPPSPSRSVATESSFASALSRLPTQAGIAAEQRATTPSHRPPFMPPLNEVQQLNEQSVAGAPVPTIGAPVVAAPAARAPVSVTRQGSTIRISFSQHEPHNNDAASAAAPSRQGEESAINAANMRRSNNDRNPVEATSTTTTTAASSTIPAPLAAALARQAAANAAASEQASISTVDQLNLSLGANISSGATAAVPPELSAALARRAAAHAAATQAGGNASASNVAATTANDDPGIVAAQLAAALAIRAAAAQGDTQMGARHIVFNHAGGQQGISIIRNAAGEHQIVMPQHQQQGAAVGVGQQSGGIPQRVLVNNPHAATVPGEGVTIIRGQNGEQHVVQQRGGRTSIRIPPGARQIHIPAGSGSNVRIVGASTAQRVAAANGNQDNNPNVIPRIPIPQLVAQAIPTSSRDLAQPDPNEDADDETLDKYRCSICYEFFVGPSSCGKCSSRFCHGCLLRVANTSVPGTISKCPACRALLTADGIVLDTALSEEMKEANLQVLCTYRGCNQRLAASAMKEHELSCEFTPMRCRNSTMGCTWHGHRKDLRHHLMAHCHVEGVAGVVDQFRHTSADHQSAIIQLQRGQTMSNQMVEVNAGLMRRALPSPTNMFDLINLIYTVSCTTAYFLYTADIWRLFLVQQGAQESRAAVANLLYMIPTVFNVCRTAIGGYRIMLTLNVEQDLQLFVDNMELGMLSITPFLLMLTVGVCFLLDGESSFKWSIFKYIGKWKRTILRDMATLALFVINIVIIETDDAGLAAVCFWLCVVSATCFFPPIILTILGSASGITEPNPHQVFNAGRAAPVVLFALRHAAISGFLGFLPAIDAAIIGQLLRRHLLLVVRYDLVPVSDGIWSSVGSEYLTGFLGIRFAMWAIETRLDEMPWITLISTVAYLLVNFLFHQLTLLGIKIGTLVFQEGRANVLPSKLGVRNAFSVYGTVSFCLWSSMLMFLAATF